MDSVRIAALQKQIRDLDLRRHWSSAMRYVLIVVSALSLIFQSCDLGNAQSAVFPNRPIKVIVGFPAGGPTDSIARVVSDGFGAALGQVVVIENMRGGSGGSSSAKAVISSEPDGYTILVSSGAPLTSGPAVYKNIGYNPLKVFAPVSKLVEMPQILAVHPSLPVKSVAELISYVKANPGRINWGSQGFGTSPHLLVELFKLETGADVVHVPYRGTAPMLTAAIAGEVQVIVDAMTSTLPHVQSGALRALAIAGTERSPKLPEIPTTEELGYPKLKAPFWVGAVVPADTPPSIIAKLNAAFRESLERPETRKVLDKLGAEIRISSPDEFGKILSEEFMTWIRVVDDAKISIE